MLLSYFLSFNGKYFAYISMLTIAFLTLQELFFQGVFGLIFSRFIVYTIIIAFHLCPVSCFAQYDDSYGLILSISEKTVNVHFGEKYVSVGEEVEFWRFTPMIDPVTGEVRGNPGSIVGRGIVDDIGIDKVRVSIIELFSGKTIQMADKVITTGKGKQIIRKSKVGSIQELTDDGDIVIDLGIDDEISEGDEFLIQRFETTVDPDTKKMTVTKQVNIGRGKVQTVKNNTSVGSIVELLPGMILQDTDNIVIKKVKEEDSLEEIHEPTVVESLKKEINDLKREVETLKAALDSLGYEHSFFKSEIETVISQLMSGDIRGTKIVIKNDEPISRSDSREVFETYKQALDTCLNRKYKTAIEKFHSFMERYPDSKLTENCLYWIAQSYFSMGYFETALEGFKVVIDDKRFKHKDDDASIMMAITYFKLGKPEEALSELQNFVRLYPTSEYRSRVDQWIKRLSS
ncbi:Cell division coordinator CpoB [subsurface metagenome]